MSYSDSHATRDLSCPNCGASYVLPAFGEQATCEYCGSRFLIPANLRPVAPAKPITVDLYATQRQINTARWVKWLVIIIVVTTVVPMVCGMIAAVCGGLAPLVGLFFGR